MKEASFTYKWNKGRFMVAGNLVKLVKVGTGGRRVGQAVLRAGHTIWPLVRWTSGTVCGQVYTVWASKRSMNRGRRSTRHGRFGRMRREALAYLIQVEADEKGESPDSREASSLGKEC